MFFAFLIASLVIILVGAEIFTNSIEWLGKKLHLGEGAVGSILAAVGTALPETMIPVIAILFGTGEESTHIGIGAILGAPFMLSTLAMFVTGTAALMFKAHGKSRTRMLCNISILKRDLSFFLIAYSLALVAAFLPTYEMKIIAAALLVFSYLVYAFLTVRSGQSLKDAELNPLMFNKSDSDPALIWILLQVGVALSTILIGAHVFVDAITNISIIWGIPAFILAIVIAPVATELPEKFNSIVWIRQGKDTLALSNITGAMVFQSSIIPSLGILLTPWELSPLALISGVLALFSASIIFYNLIVKREIRPGTLIGVGSFYLVFFIIVLFSNGRLH